MSITLGVPITDVEAIRETAATPPRVAIVLGSGLSNLADSVDSSTSLAYSELAGYPAVGEVVGHVGRLVTGSIGATPVLMFQGRVHQYQGVSAWEAAYPARLAAAVGCDTLIVTNAAGGVSTSLRTGEIVLISDHINLMGTNPLIGWPGPPGENPFIPMRDAYDPELRALARKAAEGIGLELRDGVYAGLLGPSYETPAEVAYLRGIGADVVGMSTVPEVIVARARGMRVLGFSLVTNTAAGEGLSHAEVLEAGNRAADSLVSLTTAILQSL